MFSNFIEPIRIEEIAFQDSIISFLLRLRFEGEGSGSEAKRFKGEGEANRLTLLRRERLFPDHVLLRSRRLRRGVAENNESFFGVSMSAFLRRPNKTPNWLVLLIVFLIIILFFASFEAKDFASKEAKNIWYYITVILHSKYCWLFFMVGQFCSIEYYLLYNLLILISYENKLVIHDDLPKPIRVIFLEISDMSNENKALVLKINKKNLLIFTFSFIVSLLMYSFEFGLF